MRPRATTIAAIAIGFSAGAAIGAVLSNFVVGFALGVAVALGYISAWGKPSGPQDY